MAMFMFFAFNTYCLHICIQRVKLSTTCFPKIHARHTNQNETRTSLRSPNIINSSSQIPVSSQELFKKLGEVYYFYWIKSS